MALGYDDGRRRGAEYHSLTGVVAGARNCTDQGGQAVMRMGR